MITTAVVFVLGLTLLMSYDWDAQTPGFRPDAWFYFLAAAALGVATYMVLDRLLVLSPPCPKCKQPVLRGSPSCPSCGQVLRRRPDLRGNDRE